MHYIKHMLNFCRAREAAGKKTTLANLECLFCRAEAGQEIKPGELLNATCEEHGNHTALTGQDRERAFAAIMKAAGR